MSNTIPLVDVTNSPTKAQVMVDARPKAIELIETCDQFIQVALTEPDADGRQEIKITAAADDGALLVLTCSMLGVIGASVLGDKLDNMPTDVARATAEMVGFQTLTAFLRQRAQQAMAEASPVPPVDPVVIG